ncbi:MAG: hypothetical protein IKN34_06570 [Treponema sp.]|nr:hypothetical protein [Treponema sp.]
MESFFVLLGFSKIDEAGTFDNNKPNLIEKGVPSKCLVERKESARRWQHISERRCLDATDIRASNCFEIVE